MVVLVIAVILIMAGCSSGGDGEPGSGRYFAVIAGVSLYQLSSINLNYADDDAVDFFNNINTGVNWDPGRITLLLNSQATKSAIRDAIFDTASRMGPDDFFVFYFSGHGTYSNFDVSPIDESDGTDEYLVPHDAQRGSIANLIRDDELDNWLSAVPGNNVCVICDSSFSGGMFKAKYGVKFFLQPWHEDTETFLRSDGITKDVRRPGYIVMTASDDDESPIETSALRNGVYTFYLVEGLMGPANTGGNSISAQEAHDYAASKSTAFWPEMHPQILDLRGSPYKLIIR
jgi:uncharacterized caspase-like protein